MSDKPKGLYSKLAEVMGVVQPLSADGQNKFQNYAYVTDDAVSNLIRVALAERQVAFIPEMVEVRQETRTKENGKSSTITLAKFSFTFADGETGERVTSTWFGEGEDSLDKGINKAATAAEKYFLMKTFMISTGKPEDDPDSGGNVGSKPKQQQSAKPAQKPAQAPAQVQTTTNVVETPKNGNSSAQVAIPATIAELYEWMAKRIGDDDTVVDSKTAEKMNDAMAHLIKDTLGEGWGRYKNVWWSLLFDVLTVEEISNGGVAAMRAFIKDRKFAGAVIDNIKDELETAYAEYARLQKEAV